MPKVQEPVLEPKQAARFWSKVEKTEGCWIWIGARRGRNGCYGRFEVGGVAITAHRISYRELRGPIPSGMTLDHLCRVTLCVNPDHLEIVTGRENTLRGVGASATNARKTACPRGHPYDGVRLNKGSLMRRCIRCERAMKWRSDQKCRARIAARQRIRRTDPSEPKKETP